MFRFKEIDYELAKIRRVYISGSSAAGKTYFTYQLLKSDFFDYDRVMYYHPDFHNETPVEWDLPGQLFFQPGLPSKDDILELSPKTVIILDDLFDQASESQTIDYLFRVLSGKRHLHVIIMTQRYFTNNKYAVSLRNSSNYHVLMNNADATVNITAARKMGFKSEITKAIELNSHKPFPYIFVDRTPASRVHGLNVFIEIFGTKEVIIKNMRYYLISETDFNSSFKKIDENVAERNAEYKTDPLSKSSSSLTKERSPTETSNNDYHSHYAQKRKWNRKVEQVIRRYQIRSKL